MSSISLARVGRHDLKHAKEAVRSSPGCPSAWARLGRCQTELGCFQEALATLSMAQALLDRQKDLDILQQVQTDILQAKAGGLFIMDQPLHIEQLRTQTGDHEIMQMGTGSVMWQAGLVLAKYLELLASTSQWQCWKGKHILELGCGTGVAGIASAMLGANVVLTDLPPVIQLTKENVNANNVAIKAAGGSATICALDWNFISPHSEAVQHHKFDVILLADCLYSVDSIPALMNALQCLLNFSIASSGYVLWCHKKRHPGVDEGLRNALQSHELSYIEIENSQLHPMHEELVDVGMYRICNDSALSQEVNS